MIKKESKTTECCCEESTISKKNKCRCCGSNKSNNSNGAIYCLSIIGALFYFLSNATSFGMVMIGIGKSIFWPAILMYKLLTYLGM